MENKSQYNRVTFKNIDCLYCEGVGKIFLSLVYKWVPCDECNGVGKRDYNLIECIKTKFDRFALFNEYIKDKENEYFCIFVKDNPIKPIFLMPTLAIPSYDKNEEEINTEWTFKLPYPFAPIDNFYVSHPCWLFDDKKSVMKMEL